MNFFRKKSRIFLLIWAVIIGVTVSSCSSNRNNSVRAKRSENKNISIKKPEIQSRPNISNATQALLSEANSWLGTKYRYGGNSKSGIDCSGLVLQIYDNALGIKLPRNSAEQRDYCTAINKKDLYEGDLVFFITGSEKKINHVGMYVGNGKMIHSSTSSGVIISSISDPYYLTHFHSCGRVAPYYAMISKKEKQEIKSNNEMPAISNLPESLTQVREASGGKSASVEEAMDKLKQNQLKEEKLRIELEKAIEEKTDSIISNYFD